MSSRFLSAVRRYLLPFAVLVALCAPSAAQWNGCRGGFCPPTTSVCTEGSTFLARTSGLNANHTSLYGDLICGLVTDGVWSRLDLLQIYSTQDQTTANLNLTSSSFTATAGATEGSPTWAADVGYTTAQNKYVNTRWAPSDGIQYTQDSAMVFVWSGTAGQNDNSYPNISLAGASGGQTKIVTRDLTDTAPYLINSNSSVGTPASTNGSGLFAVQRTTSLIVQMFRNGAQLGVDGSRFSLAPSASQLIVGGNDAINASRYPGITRAVGAGSSLTPTQELALYSRMATFMAGVGASP